MKSSEASSSTGGAGDYRDFEPGLPLKSYAGVACGALFDPGRFFVAVSYAWGSALFSLLVTLLLAARINGALFGGSAGALGDLAYWPVFVGCLPVVMGSFGLFSRS